MIKQPKPRSQRRGRKPMQPADNIPPEPAPEPVPSEPIPAPAPAPAPKPKRGRKPKGIPAQAAETPAPPPAPKQHQSLYLRLRPSPRRPARRVSPNKGARLQHRRVKPS